MTKKQKLFNRIIYGFMVIITILPYFTPVVAVAQSLSSEDNVPVKLKKLTVSKEDKSSLELDVQVTGTGEEQDIDISYPQDLPVESVDWSEADKEGKKEFTFDEKKNSFKLPVEADANYKAKINIKLKENATREKGKAKLSYTFREAKTEATKESANGESSDESDPATAEIEAPVQTVEEEFDLPEIDTTEKVEEPSSTSTSESTSTAVSSTSEETTSKSSAESSTAPSSEPAQSTEQSSQANTSESSTSASSSSEPAMDTKKIVKRSIKAAAGNDVRSYFSDTQDPKSILSGANLFIYAGVDENGKPKFKQIEGTVKDGDDFYLRYSWAIPENVRSQINPGDYFETQMPDALKPNKKQTGELKNADGEVYANYTIDTNGKVRMVFTEQVQQESKITGELYFGTHLEIDKGKLPGNVEIKYPTTEKIPPQDIFVGPNTKTSIDKKGAFDRQKNPSAITWTVDVNQAMDSKTNLTVTEAWPNNVEYKSVKVYKLIMNFDGTVKGQGEEISPDDYTVDSNGNVVIKGDTNSAYRLIYQSDIKQSSIPEDGGKVSFENTAFISDDKNPNKKPAKANPATEYGKLLQKDSPKYDGAKQTFDWTVKYNYGMKKIPADQAVITDQISSNMDYDPSSMVVTPIEFYPSGGEKPGKPLGPSDYQIIYSDDKKSFTIKFNKDVAGAYKITYKTKMNGIITDKTDVTNSVKSGEKTTGNKGTSYQQSLIKGLNAVDYKNQIADWSIYVNGNNYSMKDLVVTDNYGDIPGLTLIQDPKQFRVYNHAKNVDLELGKDYDLEITKDSNGFENGFKVIFKGDYAKTSDNFTIAYKTKFDTKNIEYNNPKKNSFKNIAQNRWWDDKGDEHSTGYERPFKPVNPYALNGVKGGTYNAITKKITWHVGVNLSRQKLKDASVSDLIQAGQTYVPGSLKVYRGETVPDGNGVNKLGNSINDKVKEVIEPSGANNSTWTIKFNDKFKRQESDVEQDNDLTYYIEYETDLDNKTVIDALYKNTAVYQSEGKSVNIDAEVSVQDGGKSVKKVGRLSQGNPDNINWYLTVNPSQSYLENVKITDEPSDNQTLIADSVVFFEPEIDEKGVVYGQNTYYNPEYAPNGSITVTEPKFDLNKPVLKEGVDYKVTITTNQETGKQSLSVEFLHSIDKAFVMRYKSVRTSYTSNPTDKISNKVDITANGSKIVHDNGTADVNVKVEQSGGGASGVKGKVILQKVSEDGSVLTGAYFKLFTKDGKTLLREGKVGDDGKVSFGGLPFGKYILVETESPNGHEATDELASGQEITIDANTTNGIVKQIVNDKSIAKITKWGVIESDEEGTEPSRIKLPGAKFKIEARSGDDPQNYTWSEVNLENDTTDENGELIIKGLPNGVYRATEVKAPSDFIADLTPQYFIIYKNGAVQGAVPDLNFDNNKGTAVIDKRTEDDEELFGAKFNVYKFEAKQPDPGPDDPNRQGYIVDAKDSSIRVDQNNIKRDADNNILSEDGKIITPYNDKVHENPEDASHWAFNLAPGDYVFVEMSAPDGYVLNNTAYGFVIDSSSIQYPAELRNFEHAKNFKGSAELTKKDQKGNLLQGAEFKVVDANGKDVKTGLVSDANGKVFVDQLAPGKYQFIETKAAKGYILNTQPIDFEIAKEAKSKPQVVDVTKDYENGAYTNYLGSVLLVKYDDSLDSKPLKNAEFDIISVDTGRAVNDKPLVTDENGRITYDGLAPGDYFFKETKAPNGFIVNKTTIPFTIADQANGVPDVKIASDKFINYRGSAELVKTDATGEALEGAEFK